MTTPVFRAPRDWTRLHPISPVLKGWPAVVGVGALWFYTGGPEWLGGGGEEGLDGFHFRFWMLAVLAIVAAIIAMAVGHISWRFNRYRISDDAIEQHKGVIFRQQRQARLDRLQAVDVVQPLLARIFGFAKLSIEVAGGTNSGIALEFLRLGDAEAQRNEILALAAGNRSAPVADAVPDAASSDHPATVDAAAPSLSPRDINPLSLGAIATGVAASPERELYRLPTPRLLAAAIRSWGAVWTAVLVPFAIAALVAFSINVSFREAVAAISGSLVGALSGFAALGAYFFAVINNNFNFAAAVSQDGLRLRHGLFETRRQTVPPGRVQAVRLRQSVLWRKKDWWELHLNVAGYEETQQGVSTLLPVASREEALMALHLVLPAVADAELGHVSPDSVVALAMSGTGSDGGFTDSPRAARWFDPLQWRHRGVRATETALLIRRGYFVKELIVVPHERTQSLELVQGPWQRRLGLASVRVHSTQGPVKPIAHHLAADDALALLDAQAARARQRRKLPTPEQWALAVGLEDLVAAGPAPEVLAPEVGESAEPQA